MNKQEREKESSDAIAPVKRHLQSLSSRFKGLVNLLNQRDAECHELTERVAKLEEGLSAWMDDAECFRNSAESLKARVARANTILRENGFSEV